MRRPLGSAPHAAGPCREALRRHGIRQSTSRKGDRPDDAPVASSFAPLGNERVHRTAFPTREAAKRAIFEYVGVSCNRQRPHPALGCRTPAEARAGMEGIAARAAA